MDIPHFTTLNGDNTALNSERSTPITLRDFQASLYVWGQRRDGELAGLMRMPD